MVQGTITATLPDNNQRKSNLRSFTSNKFYIQVPFFPLLSKKPKVQKIMAKLLASLLVATVFFAIVSGKDLTVPFILTQSRDSRYTSLE